MTIAQNNRPIRWNKQSIIKFFVLLQLLLLLLQKHLFPYLILKKWK